MHEWGANEMRLLHQGEGHKDNLLYLLLGVDKQSHVKAEELPPVIILICSM